MRAALEVISQGGVPETEPAAAADASDPAEPQEGEEEAPPVEDEVVEPEQAMHDLAAIHERKLRAWQPGQYEELEFIRELFTNVVRSGGVWSTTKPLADLATAIVQVTAKHATGDVDYDARITHGSLAPAKSPGSLTELLKLADVERRQLLDEGRVGEQFLFAWMRLVFS